MKHPAPYGTWPSPFTVEVVIGSAVSLSEVSVDGSDIYWLEGRPQENGRTVLVRRGNDGAVSDVTPPPFDVRTQVHEYGGGAYVVDRGRVVFSHKLDGSVWIIAPGADAKLVTRARDRRYADFRFIPGTETLLCVREDHCDRPPTDPEASIVALSVDGDPNEAGTVLVRGADFLSSPRPSPDGRKLAWLSWEHPDMPWDATCLHVAEVDDGLILGSSRTVAGAMPEAIVQPLWSPAGVLHFSSDRSGWWNIYREQDGVVEAVCPVDAEIGGPHWSFGQRYFDFLADGRLVANLSSHATTTAVTVDEAGFRPLGVGRAAECPVPFAGPDLAFAYVSVSVNRMPSVVLATLTDRRDATIEVIRAASPTVFPEADISVGEALTFATAGGSEAFAFWYPPKNGSFEGPEGERPPLVVMIHGGPTGMTSNTLSTRVQWWTSRGFGVVDVNYRGSTGFGRLYRQALQGEWGVADVQDCIAAASALAERGLVDPDRLAIRGGSAGGFTALAALTSSSVFRAGASLYGIGDLRLLAGDTHKFEARYLDRLVGPLPETDALYDQRSPIRHMDAMTAGVIFFQGLDDKVVPPNQARGMVEAMKAKGLPVAHYEFAGEGHGFRKAATIASVMELELDFYGRLFGFDPPSLSRRAAVSGAPRNGDD
ncbi:prolyl oligopeptidase family serine peptidase [Rhodopila sp.]|uniref:S9 family peptidase n=1 Tax=Rhodopila sp. TaxID=2480087 RepID=UPI003D1187D4